MPRILSIQSQVIHGHVGNQAATLPLQMQGFEIWAVPVAILAHHPGQGAPVPLFVAPAQMRDWLKALQLLPEAADIAGVITGWLGRAAIGDPIIEMIRGLRAARPGLPILCDPVMGDLDSGLYVEPDLAAWIRDHLVAEADILTPNQFELEYLTGRRTGSLQDVLEAAERLRAQMRPGGQRLLAVTSFRRGDGGVNAAEALVMNDEGAWLASLPDLGSKVPKGAGDLFAALFLARLLKGKTPKKALAFACAGCFGLLAAAARAGLRDMPLVAAREELLRPQSEPMLQRLR